MDIYNIERLLLFLFYVACCTIFLYLVLSGVVTLLRSASLEEMLYEAKRDGHAVRARVSSVKEVSEGFKTVFTYRYHKRTYTRKLVCDDYLSRGTVVDMYFRRHPGSAEFWWNLHLLDKHEKIRLACWCFTICVVFFFFFCYPDVLPQIL